MKGAVPGFGYTGTPPEVARLPARLQSFEQLATSHEREPRVVTEKKTNQSNRGAGVAQKGDKEKYKALRLAGHDRLSAGEQAGYRWKNPISGNVRAARLDKILGIQSARKPAARKVPRRPSSGRDPQPADSTKDVINKAVEELKARRDRIDEAIKLLESMNP